MGVGYFRPTHPFDSNPPVVYGRNRAISFC
jgi:hypothetical protein